MNILGKWLTKTPLISKNPDTLWAGVIELEKQLSKIDVKRISPEEFHIASVFREDKSFYARVAVSYLVLENAVIHKELNRYIKDLEDIVDYAADRNSEVCVYTTEKLKTHTEGVLGLSQEPSKKVFELLKKYAKV